MGKYIVLNGSISGTIEITSESDNDLINEIIEYVNSEDASLTGWNEFFHRIDSEYNLSSADSAYVDNYGNNCYEAGRFEIVVDMGDPDEDEIEDIDGEISMSEVEHIHRVEEFKARVEDLALKYAEDLLTSFVDDYRDMIDRM